MPTAPASSPEARAAAAALAEVLTELGSEVAAPLAQALDRLQSQLSAKGSPADAALLAVREPLRRARDATLLASQIGRLASGRVVPAQEQCPLHLALRQIVDMRRREAQSRGLQLRLDCCDAMVLTDPALASSLIHALIDWALWHTRSSIELRLAMSSWPPQALLECRFALRDLDQIGSQPPATLNGLRWMLIVQLAQALGIELRRMDESGLCVARLDFALLRSETLNELAAADNESNRGHDTQPFAGWLGIVVSQNADFHRRLTDLMQPLGWALDRVATVDEAFQHCLEALPQAIVVDGALAGADLNQWRCHVLADAPGFCFIEVLPVGADPSSAPSDGLHCRQEDLPDALSGLLRSALAPPGDALTFRL